jgi:methionyl-tRNA synthetase
MYIITTPLPYINGEPHLGHLLEALFTDAIARYRRRKENSGVILTNGLDEHGLKIYQKALELGVKPENFAVDMEKLFKDIWAKYEISYDKFVCTHSLEHSLVSQIVFKELLAKGFIYKKKYDGLYCVGCEDFYVESQLEDGKCPIHKAEPIKMSEENYFFGLSKFSDQVLEFLNKADIKPEYEKDYWINFVKDGLTDISISREKSRMPWGVDIVLENDQATDQVMYVWFEAVLNYLSALVEPDMLETYRDFAGEKIVVEKMILEDIREQLPIDFMYCSKEISKFHLVIFVAMLSALDMPVPISSVSHGLINDATGHKFSKSLGNGVTPKHLEDIFGIEGTRYIMFFEINTFGDTAFDIAKATDSYNANLANNLGNVVMRITTLVEKFLNGNIDLESAHTDPRLDVNLFKVYAELESHNPQKSIQLLFQELSKVNAYLEQTKPWTLGKDFEANKNEITQILNCSSQAVVEIAKCLSIFIPITGDKLVQIFSQVKIAKAEIMFKKIEVEKK